MLPNAIPHTERAAELLTHYQRDLDLPHPDRVNQVAAALAAFSSVLASLQAAGLDAEALALAMTDTAMPLVVKTHGRRAGEVLSLMAADKSEDVAPLARIPSRAPGAVWR